MNTETTIGMVLATKEARPLDFWIELEPTAAVQLDDLVTLQINNPIRPDRPVHVYGVIDDITASIEGVPYPSDTAAYRDGVLFGQQALAAHVRVLRFEPDVLRPPEPGTTVHKATGSALERATYVDKMGASALPIGVMRNGEPAYVNLDFINGKAGGHIHISGISGVATKTTFALWTLFSILNAKRADGSYVNEHRASTKAVIFNVKGTDLLYLDQPNREYRARESDMAANLGLTRSRYELLGLPEAPFELVDNRLPAEPGGHALHAIAPSASTTVTPYAFTIREFCERGLLPMMFALDPGSQTLQFLVDDVTEKLRKFETEADKPHVIAPQVGPRLSKERITTLEELGAFFEDALIDEASEWLKSSHHSTSSKQAFVRRYRGALRGISPLVRGDLDPAAMQRGRLDILNSSKMVTVIDIHNMTSAAKAFVVGTTLRDLFDARESNRTASGTIYIVLDELNAYAPADGDGPIKRVLLDIAERGRSLGIILIGAAQTASGVEPRIVSNSAVRVVGRLDMAEAMRNEYKFLPNTMQSRAGLLAPGTMIVHQPDLPSPLMVTFPFPAWATRESEVQRAVSASDLTHIFASQD
jgi:uncharacterized protein